MAPVGLVAILVLIPLVVVAALVLSSLTHDRSLPEAPGRAVADSAERALI
jgi:hypothetical protein